jgi:hypothetical protein
MAQRSDQGEGITPEEPVARCLTQGNHYSRSASRVTERAFLPGRDNTTSVFRVDGLSEEETWQLADTHVAGVPGGRAVHGTGTIRAHVVSDVGLRLEPDDDPPRHAAIAGWPEGKDDQKSRAQRLAAAALLRLRPGF